MLFLCREVLGVNIDEVTPGVRAKGGERLPVVLSVPETLALLHAMSGGPRLMATIFYGGGLAAPRKTRIPARVTPGGALHVARSPHP